MEKLTLQGAVELLGLDIDTSKRAVNVPCPCCARGREKKMNLNFEKNMFRCNKCELKGGPLHFWSIYRGLPYPYTKEDNSIIAKDYFEYVGHNEEKSKNVKKVEKQYKRIDVDTAPVGIRNRTYQGLLELLTLTNNHKENLTKRGLDEETIRKNEYRSYPVTGLTDIADMLLQRGYILEGVPGFYMDNGKWTLLRLSSGILIPQRDGFGRIQGFQIRLDKSSTSRYITLSTSEREQGAKGNSYAHFRRGAKGIQEVIITEGPLKGDVISYFTEYSVLAMQGVNALEHTETALLDLKNAGMKEVLIAFDMDLFDNAKVQKALEKLKQYLANIEISFRTVLWDKSQKGLDDYLLAIHKQK